MPRYIDIDQERLSHLHEGLELLEMVDREAIAGLDLCVYGITNNASILDSAKEAIADSEEVAEQDVALTEIAVAIPISSDTIYALNGSGIRLSREDFAYMGSGGEGVRTMTFAFAHFKSTVTLNSFSKLAIASSDSWLDDFLRKEGSGQQAKVTPAVHRTEEATVPGAPPAPEIPKRTSVMGGPRLASLIDEFLA
jgi:hypothetical protein